MEKPIEVTTLENNGLKVTKVIAQATGAYDFIVESPHSSKTAYTLAKERNCTVDMGIIIPIFMVTKCLPDMKAFEGICLNYLGYWPDMRGPDGYRLSPEGWRNVVNYWLSIAECK